MPKPRAGRFSLAEPDVVTSAELPAASFSELPVATSAELQMVGSKVDERGRIADDCPRQRRIREVSKWAMNSLSAIPAS